RSSFTDAPRAGYCRAARPIPTHGYDRFGGRNGRAKASGSRGDSRGFESDPVRARTERPGHRGGTSARRAGNQSSRSGWHDPFYWRSGLKRAKTMRLAHFFIEHPRFATVLSAFVTLLGLGALAVLRSEEHTSELQSPCNLVC